MLALLLIGCGNTSVYEPSVNQVNNESNLFEVPRSGMYDSEGIAIVTKISEINKTITLYDYEVGKSYTLNYDGVTRFSDRYDTAMSIGQVKKGSLVEVKFLKSNKSLVSLKESAEGFVLYDVTGVEINAAAKVFTYNDDSYKITKDTVLISESGKISLSDINALDKLTVSGIDNTILSILVDKGHGYLKLSGEEYFIEGFIEIGAKQIEKITEKMLIMVPEGDYEVKVSNRGTSTVKKVSIKAGEETTLDLSDVDIEEAKTGSVLFAINPVNATLKIDGVVYNPTKLLTFEYGMHELTVSCKGYETVTKFFNVGAENASLSISLEKVEEEKAEEKKNTEGYYVYVTAPIEVEVYVDNTYIGLSPVAFPKTSGLHILTLRKTGYETRSFNISIEDTAEDVRYTFDNLAPVSTQSQNKETTETEVKEEDNITSVSTVSTPES